MGFRMTDEGTCLFPICMIRSLWALVRQEQELVGLKMAEAGAEICGTQDGRSRNLLTLDATSRDLWGSGWQMKKLANFGIA